jgi:CRP/FNR family transcriptional regulator, anaerobic regulatory protein
MQVPAELKVIVDNIVAITQQEWESFVSKMQRKDFNKNTLVVAPHNACDFIFFLAEGYTRHFYINADEKEVTTWLSKPGDIVTELYGFYTTRSPLYGIKTITSTCIYYLKRRHLFELYNESHAWERFGRIIAEQSMIKISDMALILQTGDATDKYAFMLQNNPELLNIISLGQIASFLGLSQETVSRIRRKIVNPNF